MSSLKTTNILHPSSASNNIVLDSSGNIAVQAGTAGAPAIQASGDSNTGIYFPAADTVSITTGGSQRATVDSSGRLLVGASSAFSTRNVGTDYELGIEDSGATKYAALALRTNSSDTYGAYLVFSKSKGNTANSNTIVASGDTLGEITFEGTDGLNPRRAASIGAYVDGTPGVDDMPGRIVLSTTADGASSPTERMRITNDGKVGIGTTSPSANKLHVVGTTDAIKVSSSGTNVYGYWSDGTINVIGPGVVSGNNGFLGTESNHDFVFRTNNTTRMTIAAGGSVSVVGALSKGSGSFRIDHPLPEKTDTHQLVHSFIEGPQADLIYRGHISLQNGSATVNIDQAARMTEGTFEALCRNVCCFTTNESDWTPVRGAVSGNILTIEAQDPTSTAEICWMVIGERKDKHMLETDWTDEDGRVITEPLKESAPAKAL